MAKVIVTGGTGFLGVPLVEKLNELGHDLNFKKKISQFIIQSTLIEYFLLLVLMKVIAITASKMKPIK